MLRTTLLLCLLTATGLLAGGCMDRSVQVAFINHTDKHLEVSVHGPGEGVGLIGAMEPNGGRISTTIKIARNELPAPYAWTAGPHSGRFTIAPKTGSYLEFDVGK